MYYREARVGILCYDITSYSSFVDLGGWLTDLQKAVENIIIHIVGTKLDLVSADPSKRQVPFEDCLEFAAKHLGDGDSNEMPSGMNACHEISAKDNQGNWLLSACFSH
jgi:GTPase SAR1 family protein